MESHHADVVQHPAAVYSSVKALMEGTPLSADDLQLVRIAVYYGLQVDPFQAAFIPRAPDDDTSESDIFQRLMQLEECRLPPPSSVTDDSRLIFRSQTIASVSSPPFSSSSQSWSSQEQPLRSSRSHRPQPRRTQPAFRSSAQFQRNQQDLPPTRSFKSHNNNNQSRHPKKRNESSTWPVTVEDALAYARQSGWSRKLYFFKRHIFDLQMDGASPDDTVEQLLVRLRRAAHPDRDSIEQSFIESVQSAITRARSHASYSFSSSASSLSLSASSPSSTVNAMQVQREENLSNSLSASPLSDYDEIASAPLLHLAALTSTHSSSSSSSTSVSQVKPLAPIQLVPDLHVMATHVYVSAAPPLSSVRLQTLLLLDSGAETSMVSEFFIDN